MSNTLQQLGSYLGHLVRSTDRHGVHSPFVYELIAKVLRPRDVLPEFATIESLRRELLQSPESIRVNDLGAGSRVFTTETRRVADIARTALKSPKQAAMLFRLARHFRPAQVLELGTSFGISTLYLATGADDGNVTTIEGCPQAHRIAQQLFRRSGLRNIAPVLGSFQKRLPELLHQIKALDMVFLDGNHAKGPTLDYFGQCVTRCHNGSVLVLDDIHWSTGMEEAWEEIKSDPRVTVTIDLYDMGLVFLRKEQAKEHFILRY
jgi:predicted O-methyltransferase YrrM